jgi:hypothetical protein
MSSPRQALEAAGCDVFVYFDKTREARRRPMQTPD